MFGHLFLCTTSLVCIVFKLLWSKSEKGQNGHLCTYKIHKKIKKASPCRTGAVANAATVLQWQLRTLWCGAVLDSCVLSRPRTKGSRGTLRPRLTGSLLCSWYLFQLQAVKWGELKRPGRLCKEEQENAASEEVWTLPGLAQYTSTWLTDAAAAACSVESIIKYFEYHRAIHYKYKYNKVSLLE